MYEFPGVKAIFLSYLAPVLHLCVCFRHVAIVLAFFGVVCWRFFGRFFWFWCLWFWQWWRWHLLELGGDFDHCLGLCFLWGSQGIALCRVLSMLEQKYEKVLLSLQLQKQGVLFKRQHQTYHFQPGGEVTPGLPVPELQVPSHPPP